MTAGNASNGFQSNYFSKDAMGNTTNLNTGQTTYNTGNLNTKASGGSGKQDDEKGSGG